ncbi:uncharacterized protein (DUF1330 family) [Tolumonas osonensis]|uniref:Uncharacterized protein (DUF1330 family) n=1 Tax=Tolumonas osonensis TaxID=675874 RepID=A0A841GLP4_9GAMM|nr:uncharacterized protein (DUF1330 family) [Tolumonas osonensis]
MSGSDSFKFGAIIKFESKEIALQWYHSEEYQSLIPLREKGMNSRFSIIG